MKHSLLCLIASASVLFSSICYAGQLAPSSFDPSSEEFTLVEFSDNDPFLTGNQQENLWKIIDCVDNLRITDLYNSLFQYNSEQPDDDISAVLSLIEEYGDLEGLESKYDDFTHWYDIHYSGYDGISEEHFIYPHYYYGEYKLRLGFRQKEWLFAEDMILKRTPDFMHEGIWFRGKSYDFERNVVDGGFIEESKEEDLYDSDVDYLYDSDELQLRFSNDESGQFIDYTLTSEDLTALKKVGSYMKLRDGILALRRK